MPIPRFLSVIYTLMIRATDPDARGELERSLDWPPDPEDWGGGVDAEAGQSGMLGLMGI